jgi:hypothetical protein
MNTIFGVIVAAFLVGVVLLQLMLVYAHQKKWQQASMKYIEWAVCRVYDGNRS